MTTTIRPALTPAQWKEHRAGPSLVFESETAVRRVRDFPADWRKLSDDDLFALSWTIDEVRHSPWLPPAAYSCLLRRRPVADAANSIT